MDADGRHFVIPTSSPSQFDAEALHNTVSRIANLEPSALYLTHYSQVTDVPRLAADMHRLIDAYTAIALDNRHAGADRHIQIRRGLQELYLREASEQGWGLQGEALLTLLDLDTELNAQGLGLWVDAQT